MMISTVLQPEAVGEIMSEQRPHGKRSEKTRVTEGSLRLPASRVATTPLIRQHEARIDLFNQEYQENAYLNHPEVSLATVRHF